MLLGWLLLTPAGVVGYQSAWPAQRVVAALAGVLYLGYFHRWWRICATTGRLPKLGAERASACLHLVPAFGRAIVLLIAGRNPTPGMCWALRRCLLAWRWGVRRAGAWLKTCLAFAGFAAWLYCLYGLWPRICPGRLRGMLCATPEFENLHASAV